MRDLVIGYLAIAALVAVLLLLLALIALADAKNVHRSLQRRRIDAANARRFFRNARWSLLWPVLAFVGVAGWVADARATLKEL